jgi:hypothetical protein
MPTIPCPTTRLGSLDGPAHPGSTVSDECSARMLRNPLHSLKSPTSLSRSASSVVQKPKMIVDSTYCVALRQVRSNNRIGGDWRARRCQPSRVPPRRQRASRLNRLAGRLAVWRCRASRWTSPPCRGNALDPQRRGYFCRPVMRISGRRCGMDGLLDLHAAAFVGGRRPRNFAIPVATDI